MKEEGNSLKNPTDVRWLTTYIAVCSFNALNKKQRDMIHRELYDHISNDKFTFKEAIGDVYANSSILESYADFLGPVNNAVKIFQVY